MWNMDTLTCMPTTSSPFRTASLSHNSLNCGQVGPTTWSTTEHTTHYTFPARQFYWNQEVVGAIGCFPHTNHCKSLVRQFYHQQPNKIPALYHTRAVSTVRTALNFTGATQTDVQRHCTHRWYQTTCIRPEATICVTSPPLLKCNLQAELHLHLIAIHNHRKFRSGYPSSDLAQHMPSSDISHTMCRGLPAVMRCLCDTTHRPEIKPTLLPILTFTVEVDAVILHGVY